MVVSAQTPAPTMLAEGWRQQVSTAQHGTPSDEKPQVHPEFPAPGPLQTEEWKLDYF